MHTLHVVAQKFTNVTRPFTAAPTRVLPSSRTTGAAGAVPGWRAHHSPAASASVKAIRKARRWKGIEYSAGVRASCDPSPPLCAKPRRARPYLSLLASILPLALSACSPALDWRSVELGGLRTVLPCKPDRAERDVVLAELPVRMSMAGCEAQGALFAISHVTVPVGADAADLEQAWRSAALAQMQASQSEVLTLQQRPQSPLVHLTRATGLKPDGSPVQASLAWVAHEGSVFHLAVYAKATSATLTEPLLGDLQWR